MIVVGLVAINTSASKGKYAVIDLSSGIADEIRTEILKSDLNKFLTSALLLENLPRPSLKHRSKNR